ncbi:helix-turn-helix domain-containing protein [Lactiplantibacillus modestisalitolerans]|uniref:Helix-turn-helix domain-containing protein n=1 Tax=Lactiplantibacillus modestisalitolerans TaxID=1457219 RepID=A0ABV5WQW1_9LACO|nr:helix-turn-helix domain-containing protein [Lactiplantibacillus modestisalitolerans]
MSEKLSVILGDDQSRQLRAYVYNLVADSVASAKRDAGISQKWLRKSAGADYAGVSSGTFNGWIKHQGLPVHVINGTTLVSKRDIDQFINSNGIIEE